MKEWLRASIEINQEMEFEFEIGVEYKLYKERDDYRTWEELDINDTWVECLTDAECYAILNGKITCFYSKELEGIDTDINWLFGGESEFREAVKKYRDCGQMGVTLKEPTYQELECEILRLSTILDSVTDYLDENKPGCKSANWNDKDRAMADIIDDLENIINERWEE